jgi:hypothetical protein
MCARHVSGITFTRYAQDQKIGKPNFFFKGFGSNTTIGHKHESYNISNINGYIYFQ